MRLHSLTALIVALVVGWGIFDGLFDRGASAPDRGAISAALTADLASGATLHPATAALYGTDRAPLFTASAQRTAAASLVLAAPLDGIALASVRAGDAGRAVDALSRAEALWTGLDDAARDTLEDPRPALLARADVAITDATLRLGDALRGRRTAPAALYPGTWFPYVRDSADVAFHALESALKMGDAARIARAVDGLRPQQAGYTRMRARLAALRTDLAPIPSGPVLAVGGRSVRVPHLRERLTAYGFMRADSLGAWDRPEPYLFDDSLATALGRFETARKLPIDRALDSTATRLLNADPATLRARLALNLERWRWLPDTFGDDYIWVNIPAFEMRVEHVESGVAETRLQMPVNVGSALTTGWTTPVIADSVHTVEFQPAWYVPASLAPGLFAQARRDSLSLYRQGVDVFRNGRPVDSRLVPWDSLSIAGFRFVQRPGAANPLGRVKFLMTTRTRSSSTTPTKSGRSPTGPARRCRAGACRPARPRSSPSTSSRPSTAGRRVKRKRRTDADRAVASASSARSGRSSSTLPRQPRRTARCGPTRTRTSTTRALPRRLASISARHPRRRSDAERLPRCATAPYLPRMTTTLRPCSWPHWHGTLRWADRVRPVA